MSTPREDYLATRPEPDGHVLLKTTDGEEHSHPFTHDNHWKQEGFGVVFVERKPLKSRPQRVVFPWTNIVHYEVYQNSDEWHEQMLEWLKNCDHEWFTHPNVGHYCKWCRLDMADLTNLLEGKLFEVPALVSEAPHVDRTASQFQDVGGAPAVTVAVPKSEITMAVVLLDDPSTYCSCDETAKTEHDGPCSQKPETWSVARIEPDEDGNTTF